VKCETADFQVRGHTTYTPDENDYRDVLALCQRFGIAVPAIFTSPDYRSSTKGLPATSDSPAECQGDDEAVDKGCE
jgi:hypothetical protein